MAIWPAVATKPDWTVKATPLLADPPAVTTTLPDVAPAGTGTTIDPTLQLVGVADVPLKVTLPAIEPKLVPAIVTAVPTVPEVGETPVIFGNTVKRMPLLLTPLAVTATFPVVAPAGTGAVIELALQLVGAADVPLNVTAPVPCDEPKLAPAIVIDEPTTPDVADRLVMLGAGTTVNPRPLLTRFPRETLTLPVVAPEGTVVVMDVALQLVVEDAKVPLKLTVLLSWLGPKCAPVMVTAAPTAPVVGDRVLMLGVGAIV